MMRPGSPRHLWLMAPGLAVVCFTLASIALPVGSDGLGAHLEQGSCPASSMAHWARDLHDGFWRTAGANAAPPVSSRSIAQAFCAGGEAEQAIALYRRIGVRNEDDIASLCALAERLTLAGDWTRAEWYVREADMLLHGGMLRNNLAWHYTQTDQRPSQALALALSATLADRVAATVDTLAWAYYRNGRLADATRTAEETLRFNTAWLADGGRWEEHEAKESSRRLLALIREQVTRGARR